jgi:hypothetical protein
MDFVDDDDFVPAPEGLVFDALPEALDVVDAAVRGAVDLEDVDRPVMADVLAGFADIAGRGSRLIPPEAVEALGQDAGGCRLAHAPHAGEEVGLADPIRLDGILKRPDDGRLPDHLLEGLGTVFPGVNLVFRFFSLFHGFQRLGLRTGCLEMEAVY